MTDVFEPGANKTERLALISLFQLVDSFYGLFIQDVTANAVMGVGWIDYDAALRQDVDRLLNQSTLGVDWIYLNQHISKTHILIMLVRVQNIVSNNENESEKDYDARERYSSSSSKLRSLMFIKQM